MDVFSHLLWSMLCLLYMPILFFVLWSAIQWYYASFGLSARKYEQHAKMLLATLDTKYKNELESIQARYASARTLQNGKFSDEKEGNKCVCF